MSKQDRSLVAEVRENEGKSKRVRQDSKGKTLGSDKDTGSPHLPMVDPRGWTALHHAAAFGDSRRVDEIITLTANDSRRRLVELLEQKTNTGETPLMLAAQQGNTKALKILINSGSRLDAVTPEGATALDLAARSGFRDICRVLIEHGDGALDFVLKSKEFIKLYKPYQKPLKRAPPLVEHSKSAASGSENITGSTLTPLMVAAMAGDKAATKELLESGADTECTIAETGETALMLAASNTHCGILSLLLSNGANIDATNAKGWTTLMLAARSDNLEVVDLLTSRGADVNHASPDHWTALAEAACRGNIAIIELLLKCKADTETRSMHDWTPLMHAAFKGDSEAVQLLLEYGADMNIISQHDETALLLAAAGKHTDICRTLLQAGCVLEPPWAIQYSYELGAVDNGGAESEVPDNPSALTLGWTPLMLACQNGLEEVVRMLITRGVQLRPKSPYGKTALKIAVENGRDEIVELLREYTDA